VEGGTETLPAHIAELQKLREACRGLGVDITDAQFTRVITLSMPTPSWDPVIGTLGGVLDPKVSFHVSTPNGVGGKDSHPLAKTQMWFFKPVLGQNARIGTNWRCQSQAQVLKKPHLGSLPVDVSPCLLLHLVLRHEMTTFGSSTPPRVPMTGSQEGVAWIV